MGEGTPHHRASTARPTPPPGLPSFAAALFCSWRSGGGGGRAEGGARGEWQYREGGGAGGRGGGGATEGERGEAALAGVWWGWGAGGDPWAGGRETPTVQDAHHAHCQAWGWGGGPHPHLRGALPFPPSSLAHYHRVGQIAILSIIALGVPPIPCSPVRQSDATTPRRGAGGGTQNAPKRAAADGGTSSRASPGHDTRGDGS